MIWNGGFGMSLGVCTRNEGFLGVSLVTLMWFAFRAKKGMYQADVPYDGVFGLH
jgi:hypothetical protein